MAQGQLCGCRPGGTPAWHCLACTGRVTGLIGTKTKDSSCESCVRSLTFLLLLLRFKPKFHENARAPVLAVLDTVRQRWQHTHGSEHMRKHCRWIELNYCGAMACMRVICPHPRRALQLVHFLLTHRTLLGCCLCLRKGVVKLSRTREFKHVPNMSPAYPCRHVCDDQ